MVKTAYAPVILFVYNRTDHVKETISALQKNDLADRSVLLFIQMVRVVKRIVF